MNDRPRVAIVGAGLTGSLLACFLARRGYLVDLYERRSDPRKGNVERGRSINLALSERGIDALRRIGLADQILAEALPMRGRMIHPVRGQLDFQPYSATGDRAINSISRAALNNALLDAADATPKVRLRFEHQLSGLELGTGTLVFDTPTGPTRFTLDVAIGADGAGSAVREQLVAAGRTAATSEFLDHGYKELSIPAVDGGFALDPRALHIWPRGQSMMIALPNPDRSFTCTLFWPHAGPGSFAAIDGPDAVEQHFAEQYPDVPALAPTLVEDFLANPVGQLGTVRCRPWQIDGRVALIGDAAHAIVPFYGQGANAAFEDSVELDRCLEATADDWARALPLYEQRRKANSDAIADMALDNFIEMRDKVASPVYRIGKKVEHTLERTLPGRYVSRYELVSFSTMPYAQVKRRVRKQHRILAGVAGSIALTLAGVTARAWARHRHRSSDREAGDPTDGA